MMILFKGLCILLSLPLRAFALPDAAAQTWKKYIVIFNDSYPGMEEMSDDEKKKFLRDAGTIGPVVSWFHYSQNGLTVDMPSETAMKLEQDERVDHVTEDYPINRPEQPSGTDETILDPPQIPWNLDRVDQPDQQLDNSYVWNKKYKTAGVDINICIIDDGLDWDTGENWDPFDDIPAEVKFARPGKMFPEHKGPPIMSEVEPCSDIGTHVTGTVGSYTYGIAPGVTIWPVKVIDPCTPSSRTYLSLLLDAVEYCTTRHQRNFGLQKWIIHLPLVVEGSDLIRAVAGARNLGLLVVAPAGDSGKDLCQGNPNMKSRAITVGATGPGDKRSSFSNYGSCVDIFAPGENIPSIGATIGKYTSKIEERKKSGTLMASALVAGTAAIFFQQHNTADQVEAAMLAAAVDKVTDSKSPHTLLAQVPTTIIPAPPTNPPTQKPTPTPKPTRAPTPRPTCAPHPPVPVRVPTMPPIPSWCPGGGLEGGEICWEGVVSCCYSKECWYVDAIYVCKDYYRSEPGCYVPPTPRPTPPKPPSPKPTLPPGTTPPPTLPPTLPPNTPPPTSQKPSQRPSTPKPTSKQPTLPPNTSPPTTNSGTPSTSPTPLLPKSPTAAPATRTPTPPTVSADTKPPTSTPTIPSSPSTRNPSPPPKKATPPAGPPATPAARPKSKKKAKKAANIRKKKAGPKRRKV